VSIGKERKKFGINEYRVQVQVVRRTLRYFYLLVLHVTQLVSICINTCVLICLEMTCSANLRTDKNSYDE